MSYGFPPPPPYGTPPGGPGYYPPSPAPFQPIDPRAAGARSSATNGMWISIVSFVLCCGPAGIAGLVLGIRSLRLAKAAGIPAPGRAIVAVVLGSLSLLTFSGAIIGGQINERNARKQHEAASARIGAKREAATLDAKTACDLVEERVYADGWNNKSRGLLNGVSCPGAFEQKGTRATLRDVRLDFGSDKPVVSACFAKSQRWFIVDLNTSGACEEVPIPNVASDEDEKSAREAYKTRAQTASLGVVTASLTKIRDDAKTHPRAEQACDASRIAKLTGDAAETKVMAADLDALDGQTHTKGTTKQWSFLTHEAIGEVLDTAKTESTRAAAAKRVREGGPLLVVYQSEERDWPLVETKAGKLEFTGGYFEGWMTLYAVESAEPLCMTKLEFENRSKIKFYKSRYSSGQSAAQSAAESELKGLFHDQASAQMRKLGGGKLKLGYKVLE